MASEASHRLVQSLDRALSLMEHVAAHQEGLRIAELAMLSELPPATVHRLLATLVQRGYVIRSPGTERYAIGSRVFNIVAGTLSRMEVRRVALPYLIEIQKATLETAHIMILSGDSALCVESVPGKWNTRTSSSIGAADPLHCTAVGKVFLAYMHPSEVSRLTGDEPHAYTRNTFVTADLLARELDSIRTNGYAVDNEEYEIGVRCIAAPIFDHRGEVCAAIGVSGLAARITSDKDHEYAALVVGAAGRISELCPLA